MATPRQRHFWGSGGTQFEPLCLDFGGHTVAWVTSEQWPQPGRCGRRRTRGPHKTPLGLAALPSRQPFLSSPFVPSLGSLIQVACLCGAPNTKGFKPRPRQKRSSREVYAVRKCQPGW